MSDSSSSSSSSSKKKREKRKQSPEVKRRAFEPANIQEVPIQNVQQSPPPRPQLQSVIQDQTGLYD